MPSTNRLSTWSLPLLVFATALAPGLIGVLLDNGVYRFKVD